MHKDRVRACGTASEISSFCWPVSEASANVVVPLEPDRRMMALRAIECGAPKAAASRQRERLQSDPGRSLECIIHDTDNLRHQYREWSRNALRSFRPGALPPAR